MNASVSFKQWQKVFPQCTSLVEGHFALTSPTGEFVGVRTIESVTFPHLKELVFTLNSPFQWIQSWEGLRFPALEKLRCFTWLPAIDSSLSPNTFFPLETLTHLCLVDSSQSQGGGLNVAKFIEVLPTLPLLEELTCRLVNSLEVFFNCLTLGPQFNLPRLKALGVVMGTFEHRMEVPGIWPTNANVPPATPFPHSTIQHLVFSRTQAVHHNLFPTQEGQIARLESLVLQVERVKWANMILEPLRDVVRAYVPFGLKAVVTMSSVTHMGFQLAGRVPPWGQEIPRHWDQGFMDYFNPPDYDLYPKHLPFVTSAP